MNAATKIETSPLAKLREPFPANQISKLPKESRKQIDERKNRVQGCMVWNCPECGNAHHKDAVHLDYVGHAAATDRLLDADLRWTWDPVPDAAALGLPTVPGGMWIKLTVDGVSRYGFGSADGKSGGDAIKEVIGDAIRNAGMRFGMALDLWHKGDLHVDDSDAQEPTPSRSEAASPEYITDAQRSELIALGTAKGVEAREICRKGNIPGLNKMLAADFRHAKAWLEKKPDKNPQSSEVLEDEIPY